MQWNKTEAVRYLQAHARLSSDSKCATYVRMAIEHGGIRLMRTRAAQDYGTSLIYAGFYEVSGSDIQAGDVVIIQATPNHGFGHMAMYDGQIWISDFRQLHGFYPGRDYRNARPPYKIYRHD
ncbi:NlpC/P60 family protein [Paraburkholderia antibiotica]|uniref:CHAP domain-containing protein n=1 Tax=Paraburkholderia antibiotica TaxID=2728839 RepID=A0A7X9X2L5_9BURK|nr:NlpC/P60 family protein [Paraburkholderia antibiotica]NML30266.1 CHAP domain-containing protein [Paraburkholderia antibiotica]